VRLRHEDRKKGGSIVGDKTKALNDLPRGHTDRLLIIIRAKCTGYSTVPID
jgi:hypothetical protein